jgi:Kef-type K+ transport system membrane component KefB
MMQDAKKRTRAIASLFLLAVLVLLALWIRTTPLASEWRRAALDTFFLGFLLLLAYGAATMLSSLRIPLISGYIFAGMIVGPHVTGLLSMETVLKLRVVDDLALSFIAMTAGASLHLAFLRRRATAMALNISFLTIFVFTLVFGFALATGSLFQVTRSLSHVELVTIASFLGVIAVARSPSSAIAIISESRASGVFTDTVLGVTIAMDVLIIMLFTLEMAIANLLVFGSGVHGYALGAVIGQMIVSLALGYLIGKGITFYIRKIGRDLPLFLLFMAFGIVKASFWLDQIMQTHFTLSLQLEPLLVCISAGFTVRNFSSQGPRFLASLERFSLPIFVLFFSLAGASLNLEALKMTWPIATALALARGAGIFLATWLAGTIMRDPPSHNRVAWMAYLTQAGVAIGLAQLAERQFQGIGVYLNTIVLAVIALNQIIGPITFKAVLERVGEAGGRGQKAGPISTPGSGHSLLL